MSLSSTHKDIEQVLIASCRFRQVGIWLGDVQGLIDAPKQVPAAFLILSGINYEEPQTMGATAAINDTLWSVVIFEYISAAGDDVEIAAYTAIETTVTAITNLPVDICRLWPVQARLLGGIKNGVVCYGIHFTVL